MSTKDQHLCGSQVSLLHKIKQEANCCLIYATATTRHNTLKGH